MADIYIYIWTIKTYFHDQESHSCTLKWKVTNTLWNRRKSNLSLSPPGKVLSLMLPGRRYYNFFLELHHVQCCKTKVLLCLCRTETNFWVADKQRFSKLQFENLHQIGIILGRSVLIWTRIICILWLFLFSQNSYLPKMSSNNNILWIMFPYWFCFVPSEQRESSCWVIISIPSVVLMSVRTLQAVEQSIRSHYCNSFSIRRAAKYILVNVQKDASQSESSCSKNLHWIQNKFWVCKSSVQKCNSLDFSDREEKISQTKTLEMKRQKLNKWKWMFTFLPQMSSYL